MRCTSEQRNKQNPLDLISVITEMVKSAAEIQENRWMDELEEKQMIRSRFHSAVEVVQCRKVTFINLKHIYII